MVEHARVDAPTGIAEPAELAAVEALLQASGLPVDDLRSHAGSILVSRHAGRVVASAALEMYAPYALLRSVAVDPAWRGRGLGVLMTRAALDLARRRGVTQVYLLTETATGFFPRLGFSRVDRNDVPAAVRASVEFTSACPASAVAMVATTRRPPEDGGVRHELPDGEERSG